MSRWTPERYRELAKACRRQAERSLPPGSDFLRKMAGEYDAKAARLDGPAAPLRLAGPARPERRVCPVCRAPVEA